MDNKFKIEDVRNTVEETAKVLSKREFLEKPKASHYKAALDSLKYLRTINPGMLRKMISLYAKGKEIKSKLGIELDSIFNQVWDEAEEKFKKRASQAIDDLFIKEDKYSEMSDKDLRQEMADLVGRIHNEIIKQVKSDPRIITAFSGKEDLLDEVINFTKLSVSEIFESVDTSALS